MIKNKITPFLTFNGTAEEAMKFYETNLPNTKITQLTRFQTEDSTVAKSDANKVFHGVITVSGSEIKFLDMTAQHQAPEFSWSNSIFINCETEKEFDTIFTALATNGSVMMGPESVGKIRKCAWIVDQFGVTWQPVWE